MMLGPGLRPERHRSAPVRGARARRGAGGHVPVRSGPGHQRVLTRPHAPRSVRPPQRPVGLRPVLDHRAPADRRLRRSQSQLRRPAIDAVRRQGGRDDAAGRALVPEAPVEFRPDRVAVAVQRQVRPRVAAPLRGLRHRRAPRPGDDGHRPGRVAVGNSGARAGFWRPAPKSGRRPPSERPMPSWPRSASGTTTTFVSVRRAGTLQVASVGDPDPGPPPSASPRRSATLGPRPDPVDPPTVRRAARGQAPRYRQAGGGRPIGLGNGITPWPVTAAASRSSPDTRADNWRSSNPVKGRAANRSVVASTASRTCAPDGDRRSPSSRPRCPSR